jgi:hypothetical protein
MGKTWVFSQNPCCALRANPGDIAKFLIAYGTEGYAIFGLAKGHFFRKICATSSNSGGALFFRRPLFDKSIEGGIDY